MQSKNEFSTLVEFWGALELCAGLVEIDGLAQSALVILKACSAQSGLARVHVSCAAKCQAFSQLQPPLRLYSLDVQLGFNPKTINSSSWDPPSPTEILGTGPCRLLPNLSLFNWLSLITTIPSAPYSNALFKMPSRNPTGFDINEFKAAAHPRSVWAKKDPWARQSV